MFLVGGFSFQRKMPDSYSDRFFCRLTLIGPLFKETPETTKAKYGQCKVTNLLQRVPFHFLLFAGNLQNRTRLKGLPFQFFRNCDFFSEFF